MGRQAAITRNIKGVKALYTRFDLVGMKVEEHIEKTIPNTVGKTTEAVIKYLEKCYKDSVNYKFLKLEKTETVEVLVGMKLEDFLKYAVELTPDRKFPDGTAADTEEPATEEPVKVKAPKGKKS